MIAVILAAGLSKRLRPLTDNHPKCLLDIEGKPLLRRYLDHLDAVGVQKTIVVSGFNHEAVAREVEKGSDNMETQIVRNEQYAEKGNHPIHSFLMTESLVHDDFLLMNSDIYFSQTALKKLTDSPKSCVAINSQAAFIEGEMFVNHNPDATVSEISKSLPKRDVQQGKSVQIVKFLKEDKDIIYNRAKELAGKPNIFYPAQAFDTLIEKKRFFTVDIAGEFSHELDTLEDLQSLTEHLKRKV
jgi:choline kinase